MTDGTVTQSLGGLFWEPIKVETVKQQAKSYDDIDPVLENICGERLIEREVVLIGTQSHTQYVSASSLIRTSILPTNMREALEKQEMGVGELIRDSGLETFREFFDAGHAQSEHKPACVWRTYRIVREQQAFIKITETFPLDIYQS